MSETTNSPKKSFLTRAMEAVEAKKAAKEANKVEQSSEEAAGKQALKKFALVTAASVAAVTVAIVAINKFGNEDETDVEQEETPDTDEFTTEEN
ncbi:hypothetical protein [Streptomyces phage Psst1]|nr:hypothetical protein [Streptomyces phage Psst1]WPJ30735.1 hypothetical protein [Streptomyces phage Psst2]